MSFTHFCTPREKTRRITIITTTITRSCSIWENGKCRYEKDNWSTVIRKGDVVFCRMFENHIVDCAENEGHVRFWVGIEPHLLGGFSKKDASLYLLFSNQNPNYPVMHLDMVRMQKYLWMIEEFQQLGNSPGEQIIASSIIHRMLGSLYCDLKPENHQGTRKPAAHGHGRLHHPLYRAESGPGPVSGPRGPTL
ncbi:MAG: hypothetical protein V8R40_10725 [Dysosmobacter sp.]